MKGIDFLKDQEKLDEKSRFIIIAILLSLGILLLPPIINSSRLTSIDSGFESEEMEEEILSIEDEEEEILEEILDEEMLEELEEEEDFSEDEFNLGDSLNDKLMDGNVD